MQILSYTCRSDKRTLQNYEVYPLTIDPEMLFKFVYHAIQGEYNLLQHSVPRPVFDHNSKVCYSTIIVKFQ